MKIRDYIQPWLVKLNQEPALWLRGIRFGVSDIDHVENRIVQREIPLFDLLISARGKLVASAAKLDRALRDGHKDFLLRTAYGDMTFTARRTEDGRLYVNWSTVLKGYCPGSNRGNRGQSYNYVL